MGPGSHEETRRLRKRTVASDNPDFSQLKDASSSSKSQLPKHRLKPNPGNSASAFSYGDPGSPGKQYDPIWSSRVSCGYGLPPDDLMPLFYAIRYNDLKEVQETLRLLITSDIEAHCIASILSYAVEFGGEEIVKFLLEDGRFNPLKKSDNGRSPLSYAAQFGNEAVVGLLLELGASSTDVDNRGWSPALYALRWGKERVFRQILRKPPTDSNKESYDDIVSTLVSHSHAFYEDADRYWFLDVIPFTGSTHGLSPKAIFYDFVGLARFQWEIPAVAREMPQGNTGSLDRFVVITGADGKYECTALKDFVVSHWNDAGLYALSVVNIAYRETSSLLANPQSSSTRAKGSSVTLNRIVDSLPAMLGMDHIIPIRCTEDQVSFMFYRYNYVNTAFIEAMAWICSAVRLNPDNPASSSEVPGRIYLSKSGFRQQDLVSDQLLSFSLDPLVELPADSSRPDSQCWRDLFRSGVVASHTLDWRSGSGMKMSFEMMVQLAAVENYYKIDEGIILHGFSTALVPVSYDPEMGAIKWHFESIKQEGQLLSPHQLESIRKPWYRTIDINELSQRTCFVGWSAKANVVLGSSDLLVHNQMTWTSGLRERHTIIERKGYETGVQSSLSTGIWSIAFKGDANFEFQSTIQRFIPPTEYQQAVRIYASQVTLVIDSDARQAWLVPNLSLIIHLCHRYFEVNKQPNEKRGIPFVAPSPDGSSAVVAAIMDQGHRIVFEKNTGGSSSFTSGVGETLRQVFLRISTNLSETWKTRRSPKGNNVFATELMDMIREPGRGSPLKEIEVTDTVSWRSLVDKVDVVGCCANIGQLIEPVIPTPQRCQCHVMPRDQFLLGAHMRCLDELARRAGNSLQRLRVNGFCKFGEKAFWYTERPRFVVPCGDQTHPSIWADIPTPNGFLQEITQKEIHRGTDRDQVRPITTPGGDDGANDGAVVFGARVSRREAIRRQLIHVTRGEGLDM